MGLAKIRIEPIRSDGSPIHKIVIDGVELKGVQNAHVTFEVDKIPTLHLDIVVDVMRVDCSLSEVLAKEVETAKKLMELLPTTPSAQN